MSTIVTNVKERLRSRSRRRHSTRGGSVDERRPPLPSLAINGWQDVDSQESPKTLRQKALAEPRLGDDMTLDSPTEPRLPALPPSSGLGIDPNTLAKSFAKLPSSSLEFPASPNSSIQQSVPDRFSSIRRKPVNSSSGNASGHRRAVSQPLSQHPVSQTRQGQPGTQSRVKHIPIASTSPELEKYEADRAAKFRSQASQELTSPERSDARRSGSVPFPPRKDSLGCAERPRGRALGHRAGQSLDFAPNHPPPLIPRRRDKEHEMLTTAGTRGGLRVPDNVKVPEDPTSIPSPSSTARPQGSLELPDHVKLPDGFVLDSYRRTKVSTEWLPAVTQEVVHRQETEVIHKEITRDVHIHHYYEYIQPIEVVEVLPARHWLLDTKTGKKIEIPAPEGWELPKNLTPQKPDLSTIKKNTRHYLVDDEHPNGIEEPESWPVTRPEAEGDTPVQQ